MPDPLNILPTINSKCIFIIKSINKINLTDPNYHNLFDFIKLFGFTNKVKIEMWGTLQDCKNKYQFFIILLEWMHSSYSLFWRWIWFTYFNLSNIFCEGNWKIWSFKNSINCNCSFFMEVVSNIFLNFCFSKFAEILYKKILWGFTLYCKIE